jgi:hypothetical protein
MAGYGRLALSSWSTSVPTQLRGPSGFVMSTTRVGLPLTSWLVRGYAVLVHDTFSWGSRRFDWSRPTPRLAALIEAQDALWRKQGLAPTDETLTTEGALAALVGAGRRLEGAVLWLTSRYERSS